MNKFFDMCVVVDCDKFFTSECLNEEHYRKHEHSLSEFMRIEFRRRLAKLKFRKVISNDKAKTA